MQPKKTQPGRPFSFSASLYNDMIDVVKWAKSQRNFANAGQQGGESSPVKVMVKNESGSAVTRFGVLEISNKIGNDQDFENLKALKGVLPTSALKPVVVVQATAQNGEVVEAVVGGATVAAVTVVSTSDTHAEPVAGNWRLRTGTSGRFRIVHPLTATGNQNVLVRYEGGGASESTGLPKVKNMSGYTVPEWGFLLIDGADPIPSVNLAGFKASPVFRGVAPSQWNNFSVFSNKRLVSVPGGAAPGETVDCILDGRVPARIYSEYQSAPLMCHISRNEGILEVDGLEAFHEQTNFGFPILYREPGRGVKWGLVDLMPQNQPASIHMSAINNLRGGVPVGVITTGTPYSYRGNPWSGAQIESNGNVNFVSTPTGIHFDGPSAWTGTISFVFRLVYSNLQLLGSTGLYKVPGVRVQLNFLTGIDNNLYRRRYGDPVEFTLPPSVVAAADVGALTGWQMYQVHNTLTLPFSIQTEEGIRGKTGTEFKIEVNAWRSIGSDSAQVTLAPTYATLIMHEIDPFLPRFLGDPVVVPAGGYVSSGSIPDPLAPLKEGIDPAFALASSGGLRSVTPGTGFGFD